MTKFRETHFEEYINSSINVNLHPKIEKIFNKFPKKINNLKNVIFYGPPGVGKYTQALKCIKMYSPTDLKYEKKISVTYNKQQYYFKISDIHYEIDMSILGCNSKLLWHEIITQILDIVSAKVEKNGIILCKYFNEIHNELLDNLYSYMQQNYYIPIDLKYILITEELSFIPDNILNCCEIINIPRPSKTIYNKCLKNKIPKGFSLDEITNIKSLKTTTTQLMKPYKFICDKILEVMMNIDDIKFLKFRDLIYDILIYNLDVTDCVWYIMSTLINKNKIKKEQINDLLIKTYVFFQYYNNNYRPIYHLENYLFSLVCIIHNFDN
jgi:Cdc6-like AAA superfamily ATPase